MEKEKFKTKKHLGQHFLRNTKILETMIEAGDVSRADTVLEVGPGTGTLTELLAKKTKRVIAVEKDADLIPILQEKFRAQKNVKIVHADILKFTNYKLLTTNYKLIANIPYYITSKFLRLFLSEIKTKPKTMVLMVQREIAERIMGHKESLLSLSVKAYATPKLIRIVPRGSFSPPPKVDSAILQLNNISNAWFIRHQMSDRTFFKVLQSAFQKKRKMLRQSLKNLEIPPAYREKRPENLSLEDWMVIIKAGKQVRE